LYYVPINKSQQAPQKQAIRYLVGCLGTEVN